MDDLENLKQRVTIAGYVVRPEWVAFPDWMQRRIRERFDALDEAARTSWAKAKDAVVR